MKKTLSLLLALMFSLSLCIVPAHSAEIEEEKSDDIVILFTNDIHGNIDGVLSYDVAAAIKKDLETRYNYVFLADAGDHIQGSIYSFADNGESIIKLMNAACYDVATLGDHEFDYGMSGILNIVEQALFPYISCNFYNIFEGERTDNVLESYKMFECGNKDIAFVGITSPDTLSVYPQYFRNENDEYIYGISAGENACDLIFDVQDAVDNARAEGADYVIALGHLGVVSSLSPFTSRDIINAVSGLDAFIDGHSHSVLESEIIEDSDGNGIVLTQTGHNFDRIGMMIIDSETGEVTTDFIEYTAIYASDGVTLEKYKLVSDLYDCPEGVISHYEALEIKNELIKTIDATLGKTIGKTSLVFDNYDEIGNRLVRIQETNSGSLAADALYYLFDSKGVDVDVAIVNGGFVRNGAVTGDISYNTCKEIHTLKSTACLQKVSGKQLLDALEWGARFTGEGENSGFLHVSGLTYKIDASVPNTNSADEKTGAWTSGPSGDYKVRDVLIYNKSLGKYEPLDPDASYNVAGYSDILRNYSDGFSMFKDSDNIVGFVMEDYVVLANYITAFENCVIKSSNSPLNLKYPHFGIDYSAVGNRISISGLGSDTSEEASPVDSTPIPVFQPKDTEHDKNFGIIIAIFLGALGVLIAYVAKRNNEK